LTCAFVSSRCTSAAAATFLNFAPRETMTVAVDESVALSDADGK
jgi:hypothetical protein